VLVAEFDYNLPRELIAQEPLAERAGSRLLHLDRSSGIIRDRWFRDFPSLLRRDDLVVFNNTRVFPARLYGRRSGRKAQPISPRNRAARDFLAGRVEVLLTRQISAQPNEWECLVHPGRKIDVGEQLFFGNQNELQAEIVGRGSFGKRRLRFHPVADFREILEQIGHIPLPPYIAREDRPSDRERYQTIYARQPGSVAAPTAGLHFTTGILDEMRERGIETVEVTLHVGLGTFQPVRVDEIEDHCLDRESYAISEEAASKLNRARLERRRIVAVGTTTVRTLEDCFRRSEKRCLEPGTGEADLFIYPGYQFEVVGGLLTNFHLPRSTLLMLVSAFAEKRAVLQAYQHAVQEKYRFYSYGDCMFVE
jgi:S-adenosylmethionine:tRNA ribosyltransferase-isomerase